MYMYWSCDGHVTYLDWHASAVKGKGEQTPLPFQPVVTYREVTMVTVVTVTIDMATRTYIGLIEKNTKFIKSFVHVRNVACCHGNKVAMVYFDT